MKTTTLLTSFLSFTLLGCGDASVEPEPHEVIGGLVYELSPTWCTSPCESYRLHRSDLRLQLVVAVDGEFDREILGYLVSEDAETIDALEEALGSGASELGELDPSCANFHDIPWSTLHLSGLTLSYPHNCPPDGVAVIDEIFADITQSFASCEHSAHASHDSPGACD